MDERTFIAELAKAGVDAFKALAWPVAAIVITLLLRKEIKAALSRLRSMKHGETELTFVGDMTKAQEVAQDVGITIVRPLGAGEDRVVQLAAKSPVAAVMEAWNNLERELQALGEQAGYGRSPTSRLIDQLEKDGLLPRGTRPVIHYLREARNRAAHGDGEAISEGEALEFQMLSKSISERIQRARRAPPPPPA